jgi:hypothetical protein
MSGGGEMDDEFGEDEGERVRQQLIEMIESQPRSTFKVALRGCLDRLAEVIEGICPIEHTG